MSLICCRRSSHETEVGEGGAWLAGHSMRGSSRAKSTEPPVFYRPLSGGIRVDGMSCLKHFISGLDLQKRSLMLSISTPEPL